MNETMNAVTAQRQWLTETVNVETVLKMMVAVISILTSMFVASWTVTSCSTTLRVWRAAYTLSREKYVSNNKLPDYMLPRKDVMTSLSEALSRSSLDTVLVYGARGSGKTTAITQCLRERVGVKAWSLTATKGDAAIAELHEEWRAMFRPWQRPEDINFEHQVCKSIIKSERSLVLIISVEADAEPAVLRNVLHFCKIKSYNTGNLRIVVDISSSRTAVALQTNLRDLRVFGVFVGPVSKPEAVMLLDKNLPDVWTGPRKNQISQEITERLELNLNDLVSVLDGIKEGMSVEQANAYVISEQKTELSKATRALTDFDRAIEVILRNEPTQPQCPRLKLDSGGLDYTGISALTKMIGFTEFAKLNTDIGSPHIFEIDPFTVEVSINGRVMLKAFNNHYT